MRYLLDTHALHWSLSDPSKLSSAARQAIDDGEAGKAELIVLSLVLAELYYLLCKLRQDNRFTIVIARLQNNPNYRIETITLEDVVNLAAYPEVPEMHDRLIVAASGRLAATVITKDQKIQASPQVKWLW